MVQASHWSHVVAIADLCYKIARGEENFRNRPFLSLHVNHAVPPLRFDPESIKVMMEAVNEVSLFTVMFLANLERLAPLQLQALLLKL